MVCEGAVLNLELELGIELELDFVVPDNLLPSAGELRGARQFAVDTASLDTARVALGTHA